MEMACNICLDDRPSALYKAFQCGCHGQFHASCLNKWYTESQGACPVCKKDLTGIAACRTIMILAALVVVGTAVASAMFFPR